MATSLADQLRRLTVPQTSILLESKKKASLLFDPKDAAAKGRDAIYEIGLNGLHELININGNFRQFEMTLFEKTSKTFERSVESSEVNENLNQAIKKFIINLSPYFLLNPAHKCLEWLIRRYHINEYNKDEVMFLILPYHESKIFVKCLQTMRLKDSQDPWHWLHPIQKPGVPLSKQALLNRAASNSHFLNFVCTRTLEAVREMGVRAHSLQALYNFYCMVSIGALEYATTPTETHILNIFPAMAKGLSSQNIDFCASSLMIAGQLVSKCTLTKKFLNKLLLKLTNITHPALHEEVLSVIILICRTQSPTITEIDSKILERVIQNNRVPEVLASLYIAGIDIIPFYKPLMASCLMNIQLRREMWRVSKAFCEKLMLEIVFNNEQDAESAISCILNSYILYEKSENDVITIESDDEMEINENNIDINEWYSEFLKSIERQYPNAFDKVIKDIMQTTDSVQSKNTQKSLKTVLGFLFTTACTSDNANIFENLYHYNAQHRIDAVRYLVKNLGKLSFSDDSKDLLKDSIIERITDDCDLVVYETLQFETSTLLNIIGMEPFIAILIKILSYQHPLKYEKSILPALQHLLSNEVLSESNSCRLFLTCYPFLYWNSKETANTIINSELSKYYPFLDSCKELFGDGSESECASMVEQEIGKGIGLPNIVDLLQCIESIQDKKPNSVDFYYSLHLLYYAIPKILDLNTAWRIVNISIKQCDQFEVRLLNDKVTHYLVHTSNAIPAQIILNLINVLLASCNDFLQTIDINDYFVEQNNGPIHFIITIYECLMKNFFKAEKAQRLFNNGLRKFLNLLFPTLNHKINFLTNFFIADRMDDKNENNFIISQELQVMSLVIFNSILNDLPKDTKINISIGDLIRIFGGLQSNIAIIRECSLQTINYILQFEDPSTTCSYVLRKLSSRNEELMLDSNQLPLILYNIFCTLSTKKRYDKKKLDELLLQIFHFITESNVCNLLKSEGLIALKFISNSQYLKLICPIGLEMLEKYDKLTILNRYDSIILNLIVARFNTDALSNLKTAPDCWQFLCKCIKKSNILLDTDGHLQAISIIVLNLFDNEMFGQLTEKLEKNLIEEVIKSSSLSEDPDVTSCIGKFMKRIDIDAKHCLACLQQMCTMIETSEVITSTSKKSSKSETISHSVDLLKNPEWKYGVTCLEHLQNKSNIKNVHILIPYLFNILKKCIDFEEQSPVEYTKQLILSCTLHFCMQISPDGIAKRRLLPDNIFKIDLVVQCIRGTQNPQTHHHALLLLSHMSLMIPEQVLHNMMEIFTFMGSSVVRHDDAYSFQIISRIISSIIPTLVQSKGQNSNQQGEQVIPLLRVFADIILDVPEHRRLPLYIKLLNTLSARDYLWMFLAVLFSSQITSSTEKEQDHRTKKQHGHSEANQEFPKRFTIALTLTKQFDSDIVLETCTNLIKYLQTLPTEKPLIDDKKMDVDVTDYCIFNVDGHTEKQFRHYKYIILQFISSLTCSSEFINTLAAHNSDSDANRMKPFYQNMIIRILMFIPVVSKAAECHVDTNQHKYWKVMLHHCYDILDNAISLLSPQMLLVVVDGLLQHKLPGVRKKVIELLISQLQTKGEYFSTCDNENLLKLLDPLIIIVESITDEEKQVENSSTAENISLQQYSLIALKLLSKQVANEYPSKFKAILDVLTTILKSNKELPRVLTATIILSIAEICSNLRAHSVSYLSKFMAVCGILLDQQIENITVDNVLSSVITALQKVIDTLPLFLSPYLVSTIVKLSQIWSKLLKKPDENRVTSIINKLQIIWKKLSTVLPLRVLIPTIDQSYKKLINDQEYDSIVPVINLISQTISNFSGTDIAPFQNELTVFFLMTLEFRTEVKLDSVDICSKEDKIIEAIVKLILKMSESSFRPFYNKLFEWAYEKESPNERKITFYRFTSRIAESLKSLFVLFANNFMQNVANLLNEHNLSKTDSLPFTSKGESIILVESMLQTLNSICLYDNQHFINAQRFDMLMQPIVDQIENHIVLKSDSLQNNLKQCLSQLAVAINDDTKWKQLNYEILMKTRNTKPEIRILALATCVEIARKLGEDFLPLLPETIPFMSECLEDEVDTVEKFCQKCVQEMENFLGEPLQKYF